MYELVVATKAADDLDKLPSRTHDRVWNRIYDLRLDLRPPGALKLVGSQQDWRIRVGDYRVIYEIDDRRRVVQVNKVRHRRTAYRQP